MMKKRISIVTGAARGIGKSIAKQLVEDDCFVVVVDVDENVKESIMDYLGKGNSEYIKCDIQSQDEIKSLFKEVIEKFGKIDILVNNAGVIKDNMIWKMPKRDFDFVVDVNLKGTWMMCREAAIIMRDQKFGKIVNISSRAWLGNNRGQSNYTASKAGIVGLTRVLALELGKYNVNVNAVAPGLIDTPLTQSLSEEVMQQLISAQPTKKLGKPEDIANVISFLVSGKSDFITGQIIHVDGGRSIGSTIF
ncbi:MAG: SDR family oxidoreductase [Chlorobi bacterium]|nr:SDR family oxidoreductase [Chlorobiota bacterium]